MKLQDQYSNRLIALLIKLSACICAILFLVRAGSTVPKPQESQNKREQVRDVYLSQIGVREKGTNSGPEVEKYLRYVNLPKGNPWCAAFVCWVFGQAGVENPKSGWSPDLFRDSKMIWLVESGKLKIESGVAGAESLKLKAGGER